MNENENDRRIKRERTVVKGLANIGALIGRADLPKEPSPTAKRDRRTQEQIHERTMEKISHAIVTGCQDVALSLISNYVRASIRDGYNTGHADALDQNSAVEVLLEKQFEARTKLTMPVVAAAIMEQQGLSSMTLDLAHMATVFQRNSIDYVLTEQDVIEYTMRPV